MKYRFLFFALGFFLLLTMHLVLLDAFPLVDTNEAWWGDIAQQYNETGVFRSSLLDGVSSFGENYVMAPRVVLFPEAFVFKYFGVGLFQARIVGLALYMGVVAVFWILLGKMVSHISIRIGVFFLFIVNPFVISAAHINRPEYTFVGLAFLIAFFLVQKALHNVHSKHRFLFGAGLLIGLAGEAHVLLAFIAAASLGMMIAVEVFQKRLCKSSIGFFVGGGFVGLIPFAVKVIGSFDMWREQAQTLLVNSFNPIISWWPNVGFMFAQEGMRYLNLVQWFDATLFLFLGVPFLAFAAFRIRKEQSFAALILVFIIGLFVFAGSKYVYYLAPITPFIFLFWGVLLSARFNKILEAKNKKSANVFKSGFFLFLTPCIFLSVWAIEKGVFWNQAEVFANTSEVVGSESKDILIIGEFIWWFGFYEHNYRSTHWLSYTELQDDLRIGEVLLEKKPVILLVDEIWLRRYKEENKFRYWHSWREGEREELFEFTKNNCSPINSEASAYLNMVVYKCL